MPYSKNYSPTKNIPVVTACTATKALHGSTIILVFNKGLWFGDNDRMPHSLINPNQLRDYGTIVQDNPYDKTPMHIGVEDIIMMQ